MARDRYGECVPNSRIDDRRDIGRTTSLLEGNVNARRHLCLTCVHRIDAVQYCDIGAPASKKATMGETVSECAQYRSPNGMQRLQEK